MATAESDDDGDVSSHPLAENRPGVYVQVVAPRRRKGRRGEAAEGPRRSTAPAAAGKAARSTAPGQGAAGSVRAAALSTPASPRDGEAPALAAAGHVSNQAEASVAASAREVDDGGARAHELAASRAESGVDDPGRESGERPVDFDSQRPASAHGRLVQADLTGTNLPLPPRLPSFGRAERDIDTDPAEPPIHSASLLDAPHSLRPDSMPTARRPPVLMFALVAVLSAIIVSAGLVALREGVRDDKPSAALAAQDSRAPDAVPPSNAVAAPIAQTAAPGAPAEPAAALDTGVPAKGAPEPQVHNAAKGWAPALQRALPARASAARARSATAVVKPPAELAAEEEARSERPPDPDEPLELPVNPYR